MREKVGWVHPLSTFQNLIRFKKMTSEETKWIDHLGLMLIKSAIVEVGGIPISSYLNIKCLQCGPRLVDIPPHSIGNVPTETFCCQECKESWTKRRLAYLIKYQGLLPGTSKTIVKLTSSELIKNSFTTLSKPYGGLIGTGISGD